MGKTIRDVQVTVPVLGSDPVKTQTRFSKPLMPCHPARARQLKKKGAKTRWFKGVHAIQVQRSEGVTAKVACGIDPGYKREAFTVQSEKHTYLNVLSDAIGHVSEKVTSRKEMRRTRRRRKTPCRKPRSFRGINKSWLAPSIISRWESKLRILQFLQKLYPIGFFVIEDAAAKKYPGWDSWNIPFSNIELGKTRYYEKISKLGELKIVKGYDTSDRRKELGLKKCHSKMSESFNSHNVDSWVLASFITGMTAIDNKNVFRMVSHNFYRRMLHYKSPSKGNVRFRYGGTISGGFKKGAVVKHPMYGLLYVGGFSKGGITLHNLSTGEGERYYDNPAEYTFLYYSGWRTNWVNDVVINPKRAFVGGHSLRDPEVRAKACETKQVLYGNPHFTNRDQAKKTCLKKYGVENVSQIKGVKQRAVQTLMARYGRVVNYDRPPTFTKEELENLYLEKNMTMTEIGKERGYDAATVGLWIGHYGIPIKNWRTKKKPSFTTNNLNPEGDLSKAIELFKSMSLERGVSRNSYIDGYLGLSTNYLEKKFGSWNKFIEHCGLKPGYVAQKPTVHIEDYFKTCQIQGKVLSFYEYEKYTGKPRTRLKRLFSIGRPYFHLTVELKQVALCPEKWAEFLKKLT